MKRFAPATLRNREPLAAVLATCLPARGRVVELASGSGEHIVFFAARFPALLWQPSDVADAALTSVRAWTQEAGLDNVAAPLRIDATAASWPIEHADAILCVNMIHIAPWAACLGLLAGAARVLPDGGALVLYGPFFRRDRQTAPSNEAFDASLRAQDPAWGVRQLEDVAAAAAPHGLTIEATHEMPANNLTVVLRRASLT